MPDKLFGIEDARACGCCFMGVFTALITFLILSFFNLDFGFVSGMAFLALIATWGNLIIFLTPYSKEDRRKKLELKIKAGDELKLLECLICSKTEDLKYYGLINSFIEPNSITVKSNKIVAYSQTFYNKVPMCLDCEQRFGELIKKTTKTYLTYFNLFILLIILFNLGFPPLHYILSNTIQISGFILIPILCCVSMKRLEDHKDNIGHYIQVLGTNAVNVKPEGSTQFVSLQTWQRSVIQRRLSSGAISIAQVRDITGTRTQEDDYNLDEAETYFNEGKEQERRGNIDNAKSAYQRAMYLNPDFTVAKIALANITRNEATLKQQSLFNVFSGNLPASSESPPQTRTLKFCPKCGGKLEEGSSHCGFCGVMLN